MGTINDFFNSMFSAITLDIIFWIGIGILAFALLSQIISVIVARRLRKQKACSKAPKKMARISFFLAWVYLFFSIFALVAIFGSGLLLYVLMYNLRFVLLVLAGVYLIRAFFWLFYRECVCYKTCCCDNERLLSESSRKKSLVKPIKGKKKKDDEQDELEREEKILAEENKLKEERVLAQQHAILEERKRQAELAEKLKYSDKAVSKWERGDGVPDVVVLNQMATLFGISLDALCSENTCPIIPAKTSFVSSRKQYIKRHLHLIISIMSAMLVWLVATVIFVFGKMIWPNFEYFWMAFVYAIPCTAIVLIVFSTLWGKRWHNIVLVSLLIWSTTLCFYLSVPLRNSILLFVIPAPLQILTFLWFYLLYLKDKARRV